MLCLLRVADLGAARKRLWPNAKLAASESESDEEDELSPSSRELTSSFLLAVLEVVGACFRLEPDAVEEEAAEVELEHSKFVS